MPTSVDAVAARIAELHLDPGTTFLVGLALAPLVNGKAAGSNGADLKSQAARGFRPKPNGAPKSGAFACARKALAADPSLNIAQLARTARHQGLQRRKGAKPWR